MKEVQDIAFYKFFVITGKDMYMFFYWINILIGNK
jgi:hypothetical protein